MKSLLFSSDTFLSQLGQFCRNESRSRELETVVREIISDVSSDGDRAVANYTRKFDAVSLGPADFRLPESKLKEGLAVLAREEKEAIHSAIDCVRDFHQTTVPHGWTAENPHGATVGEAFYPLRRVGIYIPGGQAPLVSTVIMTVTLAQLAGVPEIAVFTPPGAGGQVAAGTLAALELLGISEVYRIGGVQAVAAMALGTPSVRPVEKIFGPGNAYVVEAKRQVFGTVGVDLIPGPSEVMVIADSTARADWVAADLLSQAEHGHGGKLFLVATDASLLEGVFVELNKQAASLNHGQTIENALAEGLCSILVERYSEAAEVANFVAPEHLELHVAEAEIPRFRESITTAGAMMEGEWTPTAVGDFTAGPSHVLPTGRTGRFFSGLRVMDFMRRTSILAYGPESLKKALPVVEVFSRLENLDAHGRSVSIRF
ncbi:MAG: histidinol dehydrogenase [Opitutales bacterium]